MSYEKIYKRKYKNRKIIAGTIITNRITKSCKFIIFYHSTNKSDKMNTFTIKECNSVVFHRICDSPLSVEETTLIHSVLEKYKFKSLGYRIDVIKGNNHKKVTGIFYSSDEFFSYLENLCKEGIKYGVDLYLNY